MFIERSAGRVRLVRTVFVLAGVLPCVVLAVLAVRWHSRGHVEAIEREAAALIGLPVEIGSVDHPRPGTLRLDDVRLLDAGGDAILALPSLDVEVSAAECRLTAGRFACTPVAASRLAALVQDWLAQPARFARNIVVDAHEVEWVVGGVTVARPTGLHVECVAVDGARAVRVRREPESADEVRVRLLAMPTMAEAGDRTAGGQAIEVAATIGEPLPAAIVATLVGLPDIAGAGAVVRGRIEAQCSRGQWSGDVSGAIERLDLKTCGAQAQHRLSGEGAVQVASLKIDGGRIDVCEMDVSAVRGLIGQGCLDALVSQLDCRPGPGFRSLAGEAMREFDRISCRMRIDREGVRVRAMPDAAAGIISSHGLVVLDEPMQPVPVERLAWLCSPPGGVTVPASPASAWLISTLPLGSAVAEPAAESRQTLRRAAGSAPRAGGF